MSKFDTLLEVLEPLAKAQTVEAATVAAAASGAAGQAAAGNDTLAGAADDAALEELFGKAFDVTLEDGQTVPAIDATTVMKALGARVMTLTTTVASQGEMLAKSEAVMETAVAVISRQEADLKASGEMIKSLQAEVTKLGSQPGGRKAMLTVHEKPAGGVAAGAGQSDGPTIPMMKSWTLDAHRAGRITAVDASVIDQSLRIGQAPPAHLLSAIRPAS